VPTNTLELPRVAERHRVPGLGYDKRWNWSSLDFHTLSVEGGSPNQFYTQLSFVLIAFGWEKLRIERYCCCV
jgi:hypothetical protein